MDTNVNRDLVNKYRKDIVFCSDEIEKYERIISDIKDNLHSANINKIPELNAKLNECVSLIIFYVDRGNVMRSLFERAHKEEHHFNLSRHNKKFTNTTYSDSQAVSNNVNQENEDLIRLVREILKLRKEKEYIDEELKSADIHDRYLLESKLTESEVILGIYKNELEKKRLHLKKLSEVIDGDDVAAVQAIGDKTKIIDIVKEENKWILT